MLFDVCVPEACEPPSQGSYSISTQVRAQQNAGPGDGCQFEEDCFNCAHYVPGTSTNLRSIAVIAFTITDLSIPLLDGMPLLPYHPPRV
jgi:hypothetical protein